jgi:hypothetical protein
MSMPQRRGRSFSCRQKAIRAAGMASDADFHLLFQTSIEIAPALMV